MELTGELIDGFTSSLLMKNFDAPVPSPPFHKELWDLCCQDSHKVAIAAPRSFAKSTAITHAYTLANLLFRIKDHILVVSDTEGQASSFLGDLKAELLENEELANIFQFKDFIKDRETEFIGRFVDGTQFRVICKGSEQKLRGMKWRNKRPNLVVCDDIENDELVMNDVRRDKFRRWFYNALLPAGSRYCDFRIVGTVLHMDSLLERLMPPPLDKHTVTTPLKDYSTGDRIWKSVRYRAHSPDFEYLLWEDHRNRKDLEEIREDYIQQGFPEGYSQEYLNYPIDEDSAYFRKEDFLSIDPDSEMPLEYYISVDLAISESKTAAYTVFSVVGVTSEHTLRVKEVVRFRGDALKIIDTFFELNERYTPECFFVEKENIARSLGPVIYREMEERNAFFQMVQLVPHNDKIKRARGLQARMRAGAVEFDTEASWFPELQTEMLQFPRGAYKDMVDSLAWIPIGLDTIVEAPTVSELEEDIYEQEVEDAQLFFGTSDITGY